MHSEIRWVLSRQVVVVVFAAAVLAVIGGVVQALSLLLGGAIGIAGAGAYAWRAMRQESDPGKLLRAQMLGEAYKYAVVLGGFVLVFMNLGSMPAWPLFLGFAVTVAVYWAALLRTRT